jgi:hypothetical protein
MRTPEPSREQREIGGAGRVFGQGRPQGRAHQEIARVHRQRGEADEEQRHRIGPALERRHLRRAGEDPAAEKGRLDEGEPDRAGHHAEADAVEPDARQQHESGERAPLQIASKVLP